MQSKKINGPICPVKKSYLSPKLKVLGNIRKLTLKTGSSTDGFGSTWV